MKSSIPVFAVIILFALASGCGNKGQQKVEAAKNDTSTVADTGYTGIKQYLSGTFVSYEVTFRNGVREGLMKTYYPTGKIRTTFWYEKGLREDTAKWYYEDGTTIFRKTPFRGDSINGIQTQYYKSGKVKARLEFVNGLRKPFLEEFTMDGKKITAYPEIVVKKTDEYSKNGSYTISLSVNKPDVKVSFYRGGFIDGLFDPKKCISLNTTPFAGSLQLKKSGTAGDSFVGVIAEINTLYGNKLLVYKKIDLPYNDLK
jgi:hypothetical protein